MNMMPKNQAGQVMLITILTIGSTVLIATAIAGLLTAYQVRQANDLTSSAKSIFAADAGIEQGLYQFFQAAPFSLTPFADNASVSVSCFDGIADPGLTAPIACTNGSTTVIKSTGSSGRTKRALQFRLR